MTQLSSEVTRLNRALEELRVEKSRECSALQCEINESKTKLAEKSKENVSQSVTFFENFDTIKLFLVSTITRGE